MLAVFKLAHVNNNLEDFLLKPKLGGGEIFHLFNTSKLLVIKVAGWCVCSAVGGLLKGIQGTIA